MTYFVIVFLCLTIVPSSFSNEDIHNYLTSEDIQRIFHTDIVPKYEVVDIQMNEGRLHKRDLPAGSKLSMRAFGRNINVWLNPRSSVLAGLDTPVYMGQYSPNSPGEVRYNRINGMMERVGRIFEDPVKMATFVIGRESVGRKKKRINGYIHSENLMVRSMPRRVAEEHNRRRREAGKVEDLNSDYHFVFTIPKTDEENQQLISLNRTQLGHKLKINGTGIPTALYPEILVVVDYSLCKLYRRDTYELLEYLLAFWNGVDLKYRSLKSPTIRLHISGLVLSKDLRGTPFISKNVLSDDVINENKALADSRNFFYAVKDMIPVDSYDIAVTMTILILGHHVYGKILGLAYLGEACNRDYEGQNMGSVALVRDNNAFQGVHTAAHELGHLLGANHEPMTEHCYLQQGFLMARTPWYTKDSSDFSPCSREMIDNLLKNRKLDCLFNRPKNPRRLPRLIPGRIRNLRAQCKALGYESPCQTDTRDVCVNFYCLNKNGQCLESGVAALDGTSCGRRHKFCLHMECVELPIEVKLMSLYPSRTPIRRIPPGTQSKNPNYGHERKPIRTPIRRPSKEDESKRPKNSFRKPAFNPSWTKFKGTDYYEYKKDVMVVPINRNQPSVVTVRTY